MSPRNSRRNPFPDRLFFLTGAQRNQIRQALLHLGGPAGAPSEERILERLAGMFLRPGNRVTLSELFQLGSDRLSVIARLMDALALGPVAVEWWLDDHAPKRRLRRASG